jgi:hypothetical protein
MVALPIDGARAVGSYRDSAHRRRPRANGPGGSADIPARASCWPPAPILFRDNAGARAIGRHAADAGAASYGVIDNGPVATAWRGRALRCALAATFRSDISGWPDAALYPLASAAPRADRHTVGQQTDPLAPAAGRRRRFFFVITLDLGRSGGTLLTPAPRATGSSTTVRSPPHGAEGLR